MSEDKGLSRTSPSSAGTLADPQTLAQKHFRDWEAHVFGYGYGSGETYTYPALKAFFAAIDERTYDHHALCAAVTPVAAWLLINTLCHADIIEYGTSPRFGWLTPKGEKLKAYLDAHTIEELYEARRLSGDEFPECYPDACNCGPNGWEKGKRCYNPFWSK